MPPAAWLLQLSDQLEKGRLKEAKRGEEERKARQRGGGNERGRREGDDEQKNDGKGEGEEWDKKNVAEKGTKRKERIEKSDIEQTVKISRVRMSD